MFVWFFAIFDFHIFWPWDVIFEIFWSVNKLKVKFCQVKKSWSFKLSPAIEQFSSSTSVEHILKMESVDIDKKRALELATSFVGHDWTSLSENDMTVEKMTSVSFSTSRWEI